MISIGDFPATSTATAVFRIGFGRDCGGLGIKRTSLKSFLKKEDVFGVLMTGDRKSLIYQLAPLEGKRIGLTHPQLFVALVGCGAILWRAEGY